MRLGAQTKPDFVKWGGEIPGGIQKEWLPPGAMDRKGRFQNVRCGWKPLVLFMALGKRHSDSPDRTVAETSGYA
jgi:hypothetical protein